MARGRFIDKKICLDKNVDELSCDTSRLAFTWLISHLDCEGRMYGDPALVRAHVFPRRQDVTIEDMEKYIQEWADKGMIVWYEVKGEKYLYFPHFEDYQIGLNKSREAVSTIPAPPPELVRSESGVNQELLTVKLKNKLIKVKDKVEVNVKGEISNDNHNMAENTDNQPNFYVDFQNACEILIYDTKETEFLEDLRKDYTDELILEIASWWRSKHPNGKSMMTCLRSIGTAAQNWDKHKPPDRIAVDPTLVVQSMMDAEVMDG